MLVLGWGAASCEPGTPVLVSITPVWARVWVLGVWGSGSGFRVWALGFRISGSGFARMYKDLIGFYKGYHGVEVLLTFIRLN
jgi:hypothetical protein